MDCNHARLLLEVAHELQAPERQDLAAHLAECPDCGAWAEAERRVDEKLGAAVRDVAVPEGLKERIVRRLNVERDAYWRRLLLRAGGVAAALLLVCLVSYAAWFNKKPAVNVIPLHQEVNDIPYSAELVEQRFAEQGVVMAAPPQFEYRFLKSCRLANFQGKQVPWLLFIREGGAGLKSPAMAEVFVLSDRQFDLDALAPGVIQGSHQNIEVVLDPANPHYAYVVVRSAETPLSVFFKLSGKDKA